MNTRSIRLAVLAAFIIGMFWTLPCFVPICPAAQDDTETVIVKLRKTPVLTGVDGHQVAGRRGARLEKQIPNHPEVVLLKKSRGMSMEAFLSGLKVDGDVLHAEANLIMSIPNPTPDRVFSADEVKSLSTAQGLPSDPSLSWGFEDINANLVTACPDGSPLVAVIDTGIDYNHPELAGRVVKGHDFHNGDDDPLDDHGHGTHVSGIIAASANNSIGSAGVCSKARLLAIKVLDSDGSGSMYNVLQGIYAAADNPEVRVINISLGGAIGTSVFHDAIDYAVAKGKLVVAAAGNSNDNYPFFPAFWAHCTNGVLAVAANGQDGCKASFSNYGFWVSVSAPGVGIFSTLPNNSYGSWSGTSMAAPFVSGAAARMIADNPAMQANEVASIIKNNGNTNLFNNSCWLVDSAPYPYEGRTSSFEHLDLSLAMSAVSGTPRVSAPVVELVSPTNETSYSTTSPELSVAGLASGDTQIATVTWTNSRGGSGTAVGTDSWSIENLLLYEGTNVITIVAVDSLGNQGTCVLTIDYVPVSGSTVTASFQISAKQDDAYEIVLGGGNSYTQGSSYIGKGRMVGYRFQGVSVPKGAVIVSAKLSQFCKEYPTKAISLLYSAEAAGNAASFTNVKYTLSKRPRTKAAVSEQAGAWVKGQFNTGADLRDIVQEIVNRSDWQPGNALNIYANDQGSQSYRMVTQFDGKPAQAAKLEVVYKLP
ncbi:MAG: S8 family peptidase [Desulfobacteraceae bacterium]|nr:S8 family peptidase [Desulfobacteraceae bacterium]